MSSDMRASTGATPDADATGEVWVEGADWESVADAVEDDLLTVNMGPQHPSTHGVLRLLLQLDGETIVKLQPIIGYLHTGIEKNAEYRGWHQGVTFFTRMDYVANFYHEAAFCLAVERLLDIRVPERAEVVRVIIMEFNRIASHLIWLATGGMELGATTVMTMGFGLREHILDLFESQSGLRMNNAYFRPGGLAHQLTDDFEARCEALLEMIPGKMRDFEDLLRRNPIFNDRLRGVGYIDAETCHAYGITGPLLRAAGVPWDLRKQQPYSGYERYDFDVPTSDLADSWGRFEVRVAEIHESMRIIRQALDQLPDGPVMVADKHIAWPSQQSVGVDGIGNDPEYIRHIMGESMEALINHFKLVTQGFPVPTGQVYQAVESPRGELGYAVTSAGTNKPYRVHVRDPSFVNLQAADVMSRGGSVSDVIVVVASLDPVMGGVDR